MHRVEQIEKPFGKCTSILCPLPIVEAQNRNPCSCYAQTSAECPDHRLLRRIHEQVILVKEKAKINAAAP